MYESREIRRKEDSMEEKEKSRERRNTVFLSEWIKHVILGCNLVLSNGACVGAPLSCDVLLIHECIMKILITLSKLWLENAFKRRYIL